MPRFHKEVGDQAGVTIKSSAVDAVISAGLATTFMIEAFPRVPGNHVNNPISVSLRRFGWSCSHVEPCYVWVTPESLALKHVVDGVICFNGIASAT